MHVFVNATYIAALLLSPSTPPISRMGDWLHTSEVLSKLSAIMAGDSTTEGEGWPKGLTGVYRCRSAGVDMHRFKPLISLVPCNLRLWPFKENMFLSIINIQTKKKNNNANQHETYHWNIISIVAPWLHFRLLPVLV